jgi:hypothetical protein
MSYYPIKKIKTHRYLFHVAHPAFRKGILKWGLLTNGKENSVIPEGVYAHNLLSKPTLDWYPFVWCYEFEIFYPFEKMLMGDPLREFDYWRIDTHQINNEWFIDYAARGDFKGVLGYDPKSMYVYTNKDVSLRSLTLFRFQNEETWEFKGEKGAIHYRGIDEFRPYTEL